MNKYDVYDFIPHLVTVNMMVDEANEIIKMNDRIIEVNGDCTDDQILDEIRNNHILTNLIIRLNNAMTQTGWPSFFAKMHRSPKDSYYGDQNDGELGEEWLDYLEIRSGLDLILRFVKSLRIADDLKDYIAHSFDLIIYIMPWNKPDLQNEFRFFIKNGQYIAVSGIPGYTNNIDSSVLQIIGNDLMQIFSNKFPDCAIDCEVYPQMNNQDYRIIEINPLDYETDLYNLQVSDIFT